MQSLKKYLPLLSKWQIRRELRKAIYWNMKIGHFNSKNDKLAKGFKTLKLIDRIQTKISWVQIVLFRKL